MIGRSVVNLSLYCALIEVELAMTAIASASGMTDLVLEALLRMVAPGAGFCGGTFFGTKNRR